MTNNSVYYNQSYINDNLSYIPNTTQKERKYTMKQKKKYINQNTEERTTSATTAKQWHASGDPVAVCYLNKNNSIFYTVNINGAKVETEREKTERENWEHCKSVSNELDAYVDENYAWCPYCNEKIYIPDTVGDKFKCPHCGEVNDVEQFDRLSLYDYFEEMLDIDFIINSRKEYSACRICVAYGGPSIYIDTDEKAVCLYWWGDSAKYYLRSDTVDAVNDWAEDYYNCI